MPIKQKWREKNNVKMVHFLSSFEELSLWRLEASPGPRGFKKLQKSSFVSTKIQVCSSSDRI
jgi:hypothetical protein